MWRAIIVLFALSLTGCQSIDVRGQYVDDKQISILESKRLNKQEVIELLGSPTMVPEYSTDTWYYAERAMKRRAWAKPKVISQRVVMVKFDKDQRVTTVEVLNDKHSEDLKVVTEYTKSLGNEANPLQQFVRNIGRFNKSKAGPKKRHGAK